ncbi:MAG TPA: hypothetical protein VKD03_05820, partial [Burkholderiales bacterium]|nr:hypothetical protein [Burkholderiales bacterium]
MSLINKMLRDLDKRHASQLGTAAPAGVLSQHMHAVPARTLASDFFWRTMAMLMLFAVGWVAWLVWQLTPHPIVTDLVYQSSRGKASAPAAPRRSSPRQRELSSRIGKMKLPGFAEEWASSTRSPAAAC